MQDSEVSLTEDTSYDLFMTQEADKTREPIIITLELNDVPLDMELDTGASLTLVNKSTYDKITCDASTGLEHSDAQLRTYTGQLVEILGTTTVQAKYGELNDVKVTLAIDHTVPPKFHKARSIPFALKEKVELELQKLEQLGIISPITHSEWAAPIVPVMKQNGNVRICGDYRVTVNQAIQIDSYPLPKIEELFAKLSGGKYFTKLDMSQAYLQLQLDDDSKKLVTVNTHRGLFQYNRLPFGVSAALHQQYSKELWKTCCEDAKGCVSTLMIF